MAVASQLVHPRKFYSDSKVWLFAVLEVYGLRQGLLLFHRCEVWL